MRALPRDIRRAFGVILNRRSAPDDLHPRVCGDDSREERRIPQNSAPSSTCVAGTRREILVIACGALAREVLALRLDHIDVACLPAQLHNHPKRIPEAMRTKIRANR